jgi:glycosyltransferase involved in cell wall biosynthesis
MKHKGVWREMRIAQMAPIWHSVPPRGYGGIEFVVHLLTEGLVSRGHNVTLFASGDSVTHAELCSVFDFGPSEQRGQVYPDLLHVINAYQRAGEFDIIHDHTGIIGPAIGSMVRAPVLHTLHGAATEKTKKLYGLLSPNIYFNSISDYQRMSYGDLNFVGTVYNAVDTDSFPLVEDKEDYLLFVGRMSPRKGAQLAVEAARRLGMKLKLVTKMTEPHEKKFFAEHVEPGMNNHCEIIGEIGLEEKAEIYAKAKCTLMPVQWPEPFGLEMIESMAAGTPVVAVRDGSTPEVVIDGKTGYLVENDVNEICQAVRKIDRIDPKKCRQHVINNFSVNKMVKDYERIYELICNRAAVSGFNKFVPADVNVPHNRRRV